MYAYVLLLGRFVPMAVDLRLFNFRNSLRSRVKFKMMRFLGKRISQLMSKRINFTMHSVDESKSHLIRFARQKTFGLAMGIKHMIQKFFSQRPGFGASLMMNS